MEFQFNTAVRKSVPMLISLSGTSGSGKTYGALLLAAGIAGPGGKVGFIDTENGRGSLYADSPGIMAALPRGYSIAQMDAPFEPRQYVAGIEAAERAGINVLVIDSTTHEWEGIGGCCEIAERNKLKGMPNWAMAKREHKRFLNHCLSSNMHLIFCLRAREKVKILKQKNAEGETVIPIGIQPIAEKNFVFEMLLSLHIDEQTHQVSAIKVPEALVSLFPGGRMITKQDGEAIRQWNSEGAALDLGEQLRKRAHAAAENGMDAYSTFFQSLSKQDKAMLRATTHEENKATADEADAERMREGESPESGSFQLIDTAEEPVH